MTTTHDVAAVPNATTLDEATLRRVFADAPGDLTVPQDVRSMFRARMRETGGTRRKLWMVLGIVVLLGGIGLLLAGSPIAGFVLAAVPLVVGGIVAYVQHGRASDDFFDRYATARGLSHTEDSRVGANVPLLQRGDKRKWPRVLQGTIAGQDATLSLYTYTDVTTDSEGNRSETDYDFTCVTFTLPAHVAARFAGVYCSPKKLGFGAVQDKFAHDRKVELESAEFAKRYTLRVVDGQDDIALYELFSTTFVHRLATELHVFWEQRGSDLVVWKRNHETEAADLDRMCLEAWHVLHRYLEEWH